MKWKDEDRFSETRDDETRRRDAFAPLGDARMKIQRTILSPEEFAYFQLEMKSPDRADSLLGCIGCGHRMTDANTGDDAEGAERVTRRLWRSM